MLGRNGGRGSRFLSALAAANDTDPASDVSIYEQARLLFMLEEYKQIKQENLVSIGSMQQTLSFGLTGISLLIAALTQIYRQDKIVTLVILAAVGPGLLVLIERAWSAEVMRLGRASYFLSLLEPQVNAYFRSRKVPDIQAKEKILSFEEALHWETWVRGANRHGKSGLMRRNYFFILAPLGFGISSSLVSVIAAWVGFGRPNLVVSLTVTAWSVMVVGALLREGRVTWVGIQRSVGMGLVA